MTDKALRVIDAEVGHTVREKPKIEEIEIGQWYWVKTQNSKSKPCLRLGCVSHIGSNYIEVTGPRSRYGQSHWRVHVDTWHEEIKRAEPNPGRFIDAKIAHHRAQVNLLMGEIKQLTAKLGLQPVGALTDGSTDTSTALVAVHQAPDVKAHKKALIKAKEKTLPDLFKKIEEEHEAMAMWMKANLIPMEAEAGVLKKSTESIEDRIFTVELYAGLVEEVECIRKGKPASNDEKVHLFQRRHYMDEECLAEYEAGGMDFKGIGAFDRWLMKKGNRERLLPMPKCVVAFQVRRKKKEREATSISDYIQFMEMDRADKQTFLYIRNGDSYYRLSTEIKFGAQLFPDNQRSHLMGGQMWIKERGHDKPITDAEYNDIVAKEKEAEVEYKEKLAAWKKLPKAARKNTTKPWHHTPFDRSDCYVPMTPESVYYDDAMEHIADEMRKHNRIAVVMQGLLDRSPVFHPHPPWKLWTPEGFTAGMELHHDETRGLTDGNAPDFEAFRDRLNKSIKVGTNTVGQQRAWERLEAHKENERQERDWRIRRSHHYTYFTPYGNPGPGKIAVVTKATKGFCSFEWWRERITRRRWYHDDSDIKATCRCKKSLLLNVDAYAPGDFKQFFADPRTRADYLKWAPLLLAAEDWHARPKKKKKRK